MLVGEEFKGRIDRHVQHVGDALVAVLDLERLRVVPGAVARLARRINAGQAATFRLLRKRRVVGVALGPVCVQPACQEPSNSRTTSDCLSG